MRRPPDKRKPPGVMARRVSENSKKLDGFFKSEDTPSIFENQGFVHLGVIADAVAADCALRSIVGNLAAGNFRDADGIRISIGASWSEIIGLGGRAAA